MTFHNADILDQQTAERVLYLFSAATRWLLDNFTDRSPAAMHMLCLFGFATVIPTSQTIARAGRPNQSIDSIARDVEDTRCETHPGSSTSVCVDLNSSAMHLLPRSIFRSANATKKTTLAYGRASSAQMPLTASTLPVGASIKRNGAQTQWAIATLHGSASPDCEKMRSRDWRTLQLTSAVKTYKPHNDRYEEGKIEFKLHLSNGDDPACEGPLEITFKRCGKALRVPLHGWLVDEDTKALLAPMTSNSCSDQGSENGKRGGEAVSRCFHWIVSLSGMTPLHSYC